jgi:two-component system, NarL family, sensor histidine kinase UhpB
MSLRLKINLVVGVLTLLFVMVSMGLQFSSMKASVHEEVVAANRVATQLLQRTAWRYAGQGTPAMLNFLQGVGRVRSNDITLLDLQGQVLYRSPPATYKAGRDAPAWFSALVSPPTPVLTVDFDDGRLEVRANASRAALDEWEHFAALAGAALAMLLLVNAIVFWWVGRTVRPFAIIVSALDELKAGRFDVVLPALPGLEAAAMGGAFNRMVSVLNQNIETERRAAQVERELSDSRQLTRWTQQHIEQERRLIARELHDELGQSVTAMRSMALSIAQRVKGLDRESEQAAQLIAEESSRLYNAMHGMIPRLAPLVLDSLGLNAALNDLAERTRSSHRGLTLRLDIDLSHAALSAEAALTLYRAAQEGVTNALRHGQASEIELRVHANATQTELRLVDNGCGITEGAQWRPGHHGLRWLRERVEGMKGKLDIRTRTGTPGTVLTIALPTTQAEGASS